jgi:hypothetical protein
MICFHSLELCSQALIFGHLPNFEPWVNSEQHLSILVLGTFLFGYSPNFGVWVNIEHLGHHFGISWALMVNL